MMRRLRPAIAALAGLTLVASGALLAMPASAAKSQPRATGSEMTKSGEGEFSKLKITVSQTENLVNQVIKVSWSGGTPTKPEFGRLGVNYLQIMQCWGGTVEDGPPRENCLYGAQKTGNGGQNTNSRQMSTSGVVDPLEDMYDDYKFDDLSYIPFVSWTGKTTMGNRSEFFDRFTSNESNHNRIRPDGTGEDFFEIQTGVESPGLGCGQNRDGETPLCWLVVVPRGDKEVDGSQRGLTFNEGLDTSPLLASNWQHRIVFPLDFQPVGAACAITGSETALLGSDRIVEAISRWQPAWCGSGLGNFSYTVLSDLEAREKLKSEQPGMVFVGYGIPESEAPRSVVYAPVGLSGLTIAFNVESQSSTLAPEEVRQRDGVRVGDIKMTPRLLAKLLTQSYQFDAVPNSKRVGKNPFDISQDPEFLDLNPQFRGLRFPGLGRVVTTLGETDSARLVWDWIWSDSEARDWIKGKADRWGMTVNPAYKRQTYPRSDFPRTDNDCVTYSDRDVAVCTFDLFPFAGDLSAASRAASRGDTLATGTWDPAALPPGYKKSAPQEPGRRAMLVISDSPLTTRFSLTPAALRNAEGQFVSPTPEAIRAAAAKARPTGVPEVIQPDPGAKVKGAYPLTSFIYAATAPGALDEGTAKAYAGALEYIAGPGQVLGDSVGELPIGYAPLNDQERQRVRAAAAAIVERVGEKPKPVPSPEPETDGNGNSGGIPADSDGGGAGFTDSGGGFADSGGGFADGGFADTGSSDVVEESVVEEVGGEGTAVEATEEVAVVAAPAATTALTPESPVGAIRYLAILLLIAGGTALLVAAVIMQRARAIQSPAANPRRAPQERGAH
jgi:hypothetical protein